MYSFSLKIANQVIGVKTIHVRPLAICRDFVVSESPKLWLDIKQADIDKDREEYELALGYCERWDGYLETFTLLRKLSDLLTEHDIFLLHAATISVNGSALAFVGKSGTGKTTHIRKWLENAPDTFVINGDKPFISTSGDSIMVCGSPWAGKENMYTNTMIPLKSIIMMERAEENYIERISFADAFPMLLQHVYRPENNDKMRITLNLLQRLNTSVSFWRFRCNNFKDDCFDIAYNELTK